MMIGDTLQLPLGMEPEEARRVTIAEPAVLSLDDGLVVEQFQDFKRIAEEIRRPRKDVWDDAWNLYNGIYDFSMKENWQSQSNIPKVRGIVDTATASFRRALIRMKRFYHIESETKLGIEKGFYTMNLLDYWLDQVNFIEEFTTGLKAGLITSSLIYKVWWDWVTDTQPHWEEKLIREPILQLGIKVGEQLIPTQVISRTGRTRGVLGFKAVDPYNMWVGPRNSFKIEKATVEFSYLEALAKKGVYSKEAVDRLHQRSQESVDKYQEQLRKKEGKAVPSSKFNREIDLYYYWGDLYHEDGRIAARNVHYTIGDTDVVLRKPKANPFFHQQDPYVMGTPYVVPFSTWNRGIVEDISGVAHQITELSNLIIDGAQFDAMSAFEGDVDLLQDPKSLEKGLFPGIFIPTKGFENPTNKSVIRQITTGKIPQLALQVRQMLDQETQLSSSVTNALRGQQIGADTLGEFQSIVSSANASLDDAARTVEETALNPFLDKAISTVYQYNEDYTLERLTENFPKTSIALIDMTPEERYATMVGGYAFKARGVSIMMDKAQDLKQIDSFVKLVSAIPGVMTRINVDELLENIIVGIGWNPSRILLNPGSQPVMPVAIQGGQPMGGPGAGGIPPELLGIQGGQTGDKMLTPAQQVAGRRGATEGGARNNPMAQ
jgi:hypothetical protein